MAETGKSRKGTVIAVVAALVLVGGLAATRLAGGSGDKSLVFVTFQEQLDHMDPARVYTGRDIAFLNTYLFRNLVMYKPAAGPEGAELVADLATDTGTPSADAKTWTFTLRDGITWEDGSEVTCEDVKYGVSRVFAGDVITDGPQYATGMLDIPKDADGASVYKGPYKGDGQDAYDKAVSCDGKTITFRLSRPVADFNYTLTYPAFSPVKQSADTGDQYDLKPLATGPFKIESYKIGESLKLVRNDAWSKDSDPIRDPKIDLVELRFGVAEEVRDQIFLDDSIPNAVSFDGILPTNKDAFFKDAKYKDQVLNVFDPYVTYKAVNVKKVPCLDVRKALFFAINFDSIIALGGGADYYGVPGDSPVKPVLGVDYAPTTGNIHDPNWKSSGNPEYAKSLMDMAAKSCPDVYKRATTDGLTWDMADSDTNRKAAALYETALKAAGIKIKFNMIESGQYYSTVLDPAKQGDITNGGWGADWANASTVVPELFLTTGGFNLSQNDGDPVYPAFKALMEKGLGETDRAAQAEIWKQGAQIVMDAYWMIAPVFSKQQFVWGSAVGGVAYWEPQGSFLFPSLYIK